MSVWHTPQVSRANPLSVPAGSRHKQRQCEVLGELFKGPTGVANVGRMLRGTDTGRLVFLRSVPESSLSEIKSTIDTARCVAHPSLLKVVGRVETPECTYVASEYLTGVSLMELVNHAIAREKRIETAVAVRIVRDALRAAAQAKALLKDNTGSNLRRSIYPDTVWIAEFGETMLTEVGVAPALNDGHAQQFGIKPSANDEDVDDDITAAGTELLKLLTNQPLEEAEMTLPLAGELASIVARAVNPVASNRFQSAEEMAAALSALPPDMIASEGAVGDAVRKLMASVIAVRHPRRLMSVATPSAGGADDATCVLRDSTEFASLPPRPSALRQSSKPAPAPWHQPQTNDATDELDKHEGHGKAGIGPSHPAYAFLLKHGLLEHASGLLAQRDDSEDKTLVMKPRESRPPGREIGADDPTHIVMTGPTPGSSRPPSRQQGSRSTRGQSDSRELERAVGSLRMPDRVRRQILAGSVVLLLLVVVAVQLLT